MYRESNMDEKGTAFRGDQLKEDNLCAKFGALQDVITRGKGFSAEVISIEYHGRIDQPLTLIDLPGFVADLEIDGVDQTDIIKGIARKFIDVPRTKIPPIVVCVMAAGTQHNNDLVLKFMRDSQKDDHFPIRTLVVVHTKLDVKNNAGEFPYESVCEKMRYLHGKEGIQGIEMHHFGVKSKKGEPLTGDEIAMWKEETSKLLADFDLPGSCMEAADGSKIAFGTPDLGEHLSTGLIKQFKRTLQGSAGSSHGLIKELEAAIDNEASIIDGSREPLPVDKSTLKDILTFAYDQFTAAFDEVKSRTTKEKKGAAKRIRRKALESIRTLLREKEESLLLAKKEQSLFSDWDAQNKDVKTGLDNSVTVDQVREDVDLNTPANEKLVKDLHATLYEFCKELTDELVYPALREYRRDGDPHSKPYDISAQGEYPALYDAINSWIVDSFYGQADWRSNPSIRDRLGKAEKNIPFDAHQMLGNITAFTAFTFDKGTIGKATKLRELSIGKMMIAYGKLDDFKSKGNQFYKTVIVDDSMQKLLDDVVTFCERKTFPTSFSASIEEIEEMKTWLENAEHDVKVKDMLEREKAAPSAEQPVHQQPDLESEGVREHIDGKGFNPFGKTTGGGAAAAGGGDGGAADLFVGAPIEIGNDQVCWDWFQVEIEKSPMPMFEDILDSARGTLPADPTRVDWVRSHVDGIKLFLRKKKAFADDDEKYRERLAFLEGLRANFEGLRRERTAKSDEFVREHRQYVKDNADPHSIIDSAEKAEAIAWKMKTEYHNTIYFIMDRMKIACKDLLEHIVRNIMADNRAYKSAIVGHFDRAEQKDIEYMFAREEGSEGRLREEAVKRKELYLDAIEKCMQCCKNL